MAVYLMLTTLSDKRREAIQAEGNAVVIRFATSSRDVFFAQAPKR